MGLLNILDERLTLLRNHRSSLCRVDRAHLQTVARESYLQRESSLQASLGMSQLKRSRRREVSGLKQRGGVGSR